MLRQKVAAVAMVLEGPCNLRNAWTCLRTAWRAVGHDVFSFCKHCGSSITFLTAMAKLLLISALMNGVSGETANLRSQVIVVKGPPTSGGTPAQELAPICASGFNAAYAKCLGGTNSYLMIMVTDATKAYCAYTGGWAQNPENYPDYKACFPSPGQSEPLFYDSGKKTLSTWDEITVVTGLEQDFTSLSCTRPGANPCEATVQPSYARQLTKDTRSKFKGSAWLRMGRCGKRSFLARNSASIGDPVMDTSGWSPFNPSSCLPRVCRVLALQDLLHVREGQLGGRKQQRLVC